MKNIEIPSQVKREVSDEIKKDIDRGVYTMFPKLKSRLTFIANKLFNSAYIVNTDSQLSIGEVKTLIENEYLDKNDYPEII